MSEVRPVMPWVKINITDEASTHVYDWCIDTLGPPGVNWYVGTCNGGAEIFCGFRYDEDATAFKLKFKL
jgi:hypothetical protein